MRRLLSIIRDRLAGPEKTADVTCAEGERERCPCCSGDRLYVIEGGYGNNPIKSTQICECCSGSGYVSPDVA
jgi:hypothetical protein